LRHYSPTPPPETPISVLFIIVFFSGGSSFQTSLVGNNLRTQLTGVSDRELKRSLSQSQVNNR
jgi:hypothetical protein